MENNDKRTKKDQKTLLLILPVCLLLLFISLFVGSSISRSNLRKELTTMKESIGKREGHDSRLEAIEEKNKVISYIIGTDDETERLINEVKNAR